MRRTAVAVGALFWISNLVTLVGSAVVGTIPAGAGALAGMYPHATQVVAGTLIAHINEAAIIGYAVLLFPVLKRYSQGLALSYAAFKVVEAVLLLVSAVSLLSLIALSHSYLTAAGGNAPALKASADVILAQQFWAARLAALAYLVATPVLNFVLYKSQLVPRFLSVWGFAALAMLALGLALGVGDPSRGFQPGQVLVVPIILWELTLATWLIVRGFNPSPASSAERAGARVDRSLVAAGAIRPAS
jgi:hypothetical protein